MRLRDLVRAEAAAETPHAERLAAAQAVRVYFQRPERPGFLVSETEDGPVVPVFSSLEGLARFAGACAWASTTVGDLTQLLPLGVRALVDPLEPHAFLLGNAAARDTTEDRTPTEATPPRGETE
ncbi:SseB family protein [Streptomyces cacaoi]|uniref:SseB family protein n=1 Tax=Streptomyces cacaoi TaxID=1898 RepID=UPI00261CA22B|nr:SseB family protein [Streptomyces cacaoi]